MPQAKDQRTPSGLKIVSEELKAVVSLLYPEV